MVVIYLIKEPSDMNPWNLIVYFFETFFKSKIKRIIEKVYD